MLRRFPRSIIRRTMSAASPIHPASGLNEDQREWQEAAQKWGEAELGPYSAEWDKNAHFPIDVIKAAAEQGFLGLYTNPDLGGMGLTRLDTSIIFEALRHWFIKTNLYFLLKPFSCKIRDFPLFIFRTKFGYKS